MADCCCLVYVISLIVPMLPGKKQGMFPGGNLESTSQGLGKETDM
jgi:hypothetical protein